MMLTRKTQFSADDDRRSHQEVSLKYPEAKAIFSLLMEDPQISNALKQVNLNKGKSQAYDYVKKMQSYAKELYNKNYR